VNFKVVSLKPPCEICMDPHTAPKCPFLFALGLPSENLNSMYSTDLLSAL
jgi:hypothetical protein